MTDSKACPTCGADSEDHPQGLCPTGLLKAGLQPAVAAPDPIRAALELKLQGQYRLFRLLGRGGMGAVYLARDLTLDREVAIKVLVTGDEQREFYDRLRREAQTAARLSHPNIVPLHAFGDIEGMPYFVMGYVRGESLAARLRRDGRLEEEEGRRILAEIADALDHAHRQGVVHRDVKPDNVLLEDESGRALLTDFGVAKALGPNDSATFSGNVVGTPHYMSPEQAAGRPDVDGRSDIYSLGVMAYAIFAGRLPFEGSVPDLLAKHLTQEPAPLRSLRPTLGDSTLQVVERCLAKDPARRWTDARELARALGAIETSQLPEPLQASQGQGVPGALVGLLLLGFIKALGAPMPVLALNVGIIIFVYTIVLVGLRKQGFPFPLIVQAIWTEPSWWPFWYPRALRRRGNVWERLPAVARNPRLLLPALGVYVAVCLYQPMQFFDTKIAGLAVMVMLWFFFAVRAEIVLRRRGLRAAEIQNVLFAAPSRISFWARPNIAAILSAAPLPAPRRLDESPHDQLQSILRDGAELSGALRPYGAQAAAAARQILTSIEHADQEIARLARNLEPREEQRLAEKIQALTGASSRHDDDGALRELLEKQLELIQGLSARIEESRHDRNRRVELLKTLALHVASLRARSAETPSEVRLLSERVRALCDEIGQQAPLHPSASGGESGEGATRTRS